MKDVVAVVFVLALGLYLLGQAIAIWRSWGTYLYERALGVAVIAVLVGVWKGEAKNVVFVTTVVVVVTLSAEYWRFRGRIRHQEPETAST